VRCVASYTSTMRAAVAVVKEKYSTLQESVPSTVSTFGLNTRIDAWRANCCPDRAAHGYCLGHCDGYSRKARLRYHGH
jgi:hypothetical protein